MMLPLVSCGATFDFVEFLLLIQPIITLESFCNLEIAVGSRRTTNAHP
jgi:hypothetical protein